VFGWFKKRQDKDPTELFFSVANQLVGLQLVPRYDQPKNAFGAFMKSHPAAGYLFGLHDALLQHLDLGDETNPEAGLDLMKASYRNIFGDQAGTALLSMSLNFINEPKFHAGRMTGGIDIVEYFRDKTPPLGLNRIIVLGAPQ
jgi:hypothetical protein